jgi:antitoxin (DNA-binding transcriptional repressor) of toxin-antitoxin stability system
MICLSGLRDLVVNYFVFAGTWIDRRRETCYTFPVKTISVRDLRQRWPAAEAMLATERILIVTRDGKPVAKLLPFEETPTKRKRFKPAEHKSRMRKIWGKTRVSLVQDLVIDERAKE